MPLTLPPVNPDDPSSLQFIIDQIAKAMPETGGLSIRVRFGTDTLSWPGGSPYSDSKNIAHGLATTPAFVAGFQRTGAAFAFTVFEAAAPGATNITLRAYAADDSSPAAATTGPIYWLAIG